MPSSPPPADLSTVTAALRDAPEFLAGWLGRTPAGEDLLRERLSLSDTQLHRLLACRAPNPLHYGRDVQALARFIDVPDTMLAAALRETSVLAALATRPESAVTAMPQSATGLLVAAHDNVVEQIPRSAPAVRVHELATATWAAAPESVREERDVEAAVVWASPVVIVSMPHLQLASANRWLADHSAPSLPDSFGELQGLLVAWRGYAAIFLDGTMTSAARRFTLAHEHGHFLLDYQLARQRILRDAPDLLEVIDGHRPATNGDRAKASLARVPIGLHTHLLHRDDHGGAGGAPWPPRTTPPYTPWSSFPLGTPFCGSFSPSLCRAAPTPTGWPRRALPWHPSSDCPTTRPRRERQLAWRPSGSNADSSTDDLRTFVARPEPLSRRHTNRRGVGHGRS